MIKKKSILPIVLMILTIDSYSQNRKAFSLPDSMSIDSEVLYLQNYNFYNIIALDTSFINSDSSYLKYVKDISLHHNLAESFVYLYNHDDSDVVTSCCNCIKLINKYLIYSKYIPHFYYNETISDKMASLRKTQRDVYLKIPSQYPYEKVLLIYRAVKY